MSDEEEIEIDEGIIRELWRVAESPEYKAYMGIGMPRYRKLICPNCYVVFFTMHPENRCLACGHRWKRCD